MGTKTKQGDLESLKINGFKVILRWFKPPTSLRDRATGTPPFVKTYIDVARIPVVGDIIVAPYLDYRIKVTRVELFTQLHIHKTVARVFAETVSRFKRPEIHGGAVKGDY